MVAISTKPELDWSRQEGKDSARQVNVEPLPDGPEDAESFVAHGKVLQRVTVKEEKSKKSWRRQHQKSRPARARRGVRLIHNYFIFALSSERLIAPDPTNG